MYATGDKDILLVNSKKCAPAGTRHNATITIANRRRDLSSTAFSRTNEKTAKPIDSVRFGSKADLRLSVGDVRFTPKSGHSTDSFGMSPLCHKRTNALGYYWIASSARASSVRGTSRLATLTFRRYSSCLQRVTYCESSVFQKMQRCAAVKLNSRAKNLGSSDWNSSSALAYAAHAGVLGPFGSPVLANWVQ